MRAVLYDAPRAAPRVADVPDPEPGEHGAVIRVLATGVCRSDWHGWMGHDPDIRVFPHVPGHELAGVVEAVGPRVRGWRGGERVTAPFVCACGACEPCRDGHGQLCEHQTQPGFTHWGSWAQRVRIDHADVNLVALPGPVGDVAAAALGCRVATAFRAVVDVGRVAAGEWVAVHGCGGVGLAAVLVARAAGARVVAVDPDPAARALAGELGAHVLLDAAPEGDAVRMATGGRGAHLSLDAIGHEAALAASVGGLRTRGRHVQVGLLPERPRVAMDRVIGRELALLGSHGMAAHDYPRLLALGLPVERLVTRRIGLDDAPAALTDPPGGGITVIEPG
jgi:D-arabinose 1-dehydrogenase-like Zn-dependent alcohol dehydrogenase